MPYTSSYTYEPTTSVTKRITNGFGTSSIIQSQSNTLFARKVRQYSRSGTNRNPTLRTIGMCRRAKYREVPLAVQIARARLPVKVWSKAQKAYVWRTRKPDFVMFPRIKPAKSPKRRVIASKTLLPNKLQYTGVTVVDLPGSDLAICSGFDGSGPVTYQLEGNLVTGWVPGDFQSTLGGFNAQSQEGLGFSSNLESLLTGASDAALSKLYSRAKNQSVNLLQVIAERRQTIDLFVTYATKVAKLLIAWRQGNLAKGLSYLIPQSAKDVGNDMLAWRYGLKPLLSDIDGMAKELAMREPIEFDVVSRVRRKLEPVILSNDDFEHNKWSGRSTVEVSGFVEVTYKARCRVENDPLFEAMGRDIARLGFGNLNSVAWEVIPWSFVADWFIPVGNFLNTRDAFSGLETVWVTKTVFKHEDRIVRRRFGGSRNGWTTVTGDCGAVITTVSCNRDLLTTIPDLSFPDFKSPFSPEHWQNAAALFAQLKKSKG